MQSSPRPTMLRPGLATGRRARSVSRHWREQMGQHVAELRAERGMTQAELADAVGLNNKQIISAIETGSNNIPPERVAAFAAAFRVDRAEFAKTVLRHTNPWLYAEIVGVDETLLAELDEARQDP